MAILFPPLAACSCVVAGDPAEIGFEGYGGGGCTAGVTDEVKC